MEENIPILTAVKTLKPEFKNLQNISISTNHFTMGRGRDNSLVVPYLPISRNHCKFLLNNNEWFIEDNSTFGIKVNGNNLGKGSRKVLSHDDVLELDPSQEFVYKFTQPNNDFEIPRKRIKLEKADSEEMFNNVKLKFEESQSYELKHIEEKIQNAKNMQATSKILKEKLKSDMTIKIQELENDFALQIENIRGEKDEVEKQKALLLSERDAQLATVKEEMDGKIAALMGQIQKHNETESELLKENNTLKENLLKEREEFLAELNRESSSKQHMLDKLEAKMREQEEIRFKEKQELEITLRNETEQLRLAKEKELKELEEQKKQSEMDLQQKLISIKKDLQEQVLQAAQDKLRAEEMLTEQMAQRKKLSDEEKAKIEKLIQEREEIQKKLAESQVNADKSIEELQSRVAQRETELATLAADRIQKQADQSSEVISSLQEQLEKVKNQLKSVETEKNSLIESICIDTASTSDSKASTLAHVGELLESELQCSICAELFVVATTLGCSHTFCKYCITMWKKKKKDCPICRTSITSECRSLVLDSFIDKMVQNLTEEMKTKRQDLLKSREELESELACQLSVGTSRRSFSYDESDYLDSEDELLEEGQEGEEDFEVFEGDDDYDSDWAVIRRDFDNDSTDSDGRSDEDVFGAFEHSGTSTNVSATDGDTSHVQDTTDGGTDGNGTRRRRGTIPGRPGSYYGGYGRCFNCGARGHWAPGCPLR